MGKTGAMVENTDLKPSPKSDQKPAPRIAPLVTRNDGSRDDMLTDRILDNGTDDAIAPPDYVLNSVLGESNGLVYQNLYNSMVQSNGAFDKIGDLNAFMIKTEFASLKSKL